MLAVQHRKTATTTTPSHLFPSCSAFSLCHITWLMLLEMKTEKEVKK